MKIKNGVFESSLDVKTIKIQIVLLLIFGSLSFTSFEDEIEKCLIKVNETILFSNKLASNTLSSFSSLKKGSYDGSGFELKIDTANRITLSDISQADGPKQDEFIIVGCTGSLTRVEEILSIKFEKCRKGYYLINLDSSALVGNFDTIVKVVLKSENSNGKPAEYYCSEKVLGNRMKKMITTTNGKPKEENIMEDDNPSIRVVNLTAVPSGIKKDDLFVSKHATRTIAHFVKIEIEIKEGRIMRFPPGSYILCEGNSLTLK